MIWKLWTIYHLGTHHPNSLLQLPSYKIDFYLLILDGMEILLQEALFMDYSVIAIKSSKVVPSPVHSSRLADAFYYFLILSRVGW